MSSTQQNSMLGQPSGLRKSLGVIALAALMIGFLWFADIYLNHPLLQRPQDFIQVWSAGKLTLARESPYDAKKVLDIQTVLDLQMANPSHRRYASIMWVPPWGLAIALPLGALPVAYAQGIWIFGQVGLIFLAGLILWRLMGGRPDRWWVVAILVFSSGPVWWQIAIGQNAGLLLFGIAAYLWAFKAKRPILAGLCLTLISLKPHLFVFFAVGLLIDASLSSLGRRVVLGGAAGLTVCAIAATIAFPGIWGEYIAAITGERSPYAPGLRDWFCPTIPAWIRFATPGHAFWIQVVPCAVAAVGFGVYWWRRGNPNRWPETLNWVIPAGLLLAPYGSWPSDLTLMLVPIFSVVARVDARDWVVSGRARLAVAYSVTNLLVILMFVMVEGNALYVWVAPVLSGCLLWARSGLNPQQSPIAEDAESASEQHGLQPQATA